MINVFEKDTRENPNAEWKLLDSFAKREYAEDYIELIKSDDDRNNIKGIFYKIK
jgi:hypothetical protein